MEENKDMNENINDVAEEKIDVTAEEAAKETAEEPVNESEVKDKADEIVEKIKALVKEGNVKRLRIRKDDTIVLNLPMTVGVAGTLIGLAVAPWAIILGTITTIGLKCTVEVENKDGSITTIHGKAS